MKKLRYLLFTLIVLLVNLSIVSANEIYSIDVDMVIDSKGNAKVTEVWDMSVSTGTEVYKPMGNLGNSTITNYNVSMDGNVFTYVSNWDTSGSLSSKANKNGINHTDDGIELCFGMTSYGRHRYVMSYDVTNVIYNVEDAQVLYWKFINNDMDPAPKKFTVTVSGPVNYEDTLDVWGYGYEGYAYVADGVISMSNIETRNFKSSEYGVLLVKYPLNTFTTNNSIDAFKTFDDFYNQAKSGSYSFDKLSVWDIIVIVLVVLIFVVVGVIIIIAVYILSKEGSYVHNKINMKEINSFREIPCDKNILNAYLLSKIYNLYKKKEDLFGAALLKWTLDGTVKIIKTEKEGAFKTKEIVSIDMTKDYNDDSPLKELYSMLKEASNDGILESDELEKWSSKNYNKLYKWFDSVEKYVKDNYVNKGLITKDKYGKVIKYSAYTITPKLEQEAIYLAGLKKFLKEVSEIHEKQPIEVNLWEYYLMYAQIFGIAKEVAKQFKDLYPELVTDNEFNYDNVIILNNISTRSVNAASAAKVKAESYSAGGGGSSFGGGGGGSFGGGFGGGTR
ncbi:MAG: DUF2207 domain-containing protein [Bacilli bacterium]|nr:DUF2207 domain-containing protein [Bacilli bacterium]